MTHILIPREPSTALLRPFIGCNTQELHEAWAAMVRIAEVQHARAGSQCPAQIEQSATLAGTTIEQYARMFNAACEALGQISDCLGINSDINPGAEPIIAAIEQLSAGGAPVFDGCWKARMLDGRAIERDAQGLGEHPDLPWLDEGMNPPKFFEALGLQLVGVSAQDQLDVDAYDAMAGNYDAKEFNFAAWGPASPEGTGWCLVSIHDTEDGPVAWWLREQPYVAATRPVRRARERDDLTVEECREYLRSGWARVRGRTEQALMLQLCEALEAPAFDLRNAATQALADLERAAGNIASAVALRAALEAPAAPAWLDGWKLVPEVATREMCAAMLSFLKDGFSLTENGSRPMSALYADLLAAAPQAPAAPREFQQRVHPWLMECFGPAISADKQERNHRFLEEALETVQAGGCTASEAHQLVDYVFGRPVGELGQEVGGAMTTLAALCLAHGIDMHAEAEKELARVWTMVEKIRAKQAAKPKHSPLPAAPAAPAVDADPLGLRDVGEALMETIERNADALKAVGWLGPMDCPSEIVVDLLNLLEEANATSALGEWVATLEVDSGGGLDYETVPPCTLPAGCYPLYCAAQAAKGEHGNG